ncbi:MAG: hypothetical protein JNJ54_12890 [Myxococcaceae bacterium]|nr:hypothetical protein [Myxococcaceae bacterium]
MAVLQPLSIGEIVDRSASFWRSNWRGLFQLLLGFQLVQYILVKSLELIVDRSFPAAKNPAQFVELLKTEPSTWTPQAFSLIAPLALIGLVYAFVGQVSGVALTSFVYPRLTRLGAPAVGDAVKVSLRRLWPTLGMFFLSLAWSVVVGLLFMLPGSLAVGAGVFLSLNDNRGVGAGLFLLGTGLLLAGGVVLILWSIIRFVLASQVLAVEEVSALGCFKRTGALSSGRIGPGFMGLVKGRLTVLITIIAFILMVVGLVTGLPELLVKALFGELNPASPGAPPAPQALVVPAQLLQVVVGAAMAPLYVVFQVVFYVDMRVRREGLDLELATKAVGA